MKYFMKHKELRHLNNRLNTFYKRENQFPFYSYDSSMPHLLWRRVPHRSVRRPSKQIGPKYWFVYPNYAHLIKRYNNRKPKR